MIAFAQSVSWLGARADRIGAAPTRLGPEAGFEPSRMTGPEPLMSFERQSAQNAGPGDEWGQESPGPVRLPPSPEAPFPPAPESETAMTMHTVRTGTVQETLLIPLYGRAVETRKDEPALRDPRAEEIVAAIDYDFARFDALPSLLGSTLRTCLFDHWTRTFLDQHPDGTVVELGAGLNTRFERVDNGRVRWVDLDLPDVAALRREFFSETDRRRLVAASVTDHTWADEIAEFGQAPYLFCAEAVLPYLDEKEVRAVHDLIVERFPGSRLALDTASPRVVAAQDTHDALSKVAARMRWGCTDPRRLADWAPGSELSASHTLTTLPAPVHDALPAPYQEMMRELAQQRLPGVEEYTLNLVQLP